jgi:hypothetical protein
MNPSETSANSDNPPPSSEADRSRWFILLNSLKDQKEVTRF